MSSPSEPPFFTIGLPTFKRPDLLMRAIRSCLDQTYPHFQVLVSDDSPDDRSQKVVESFSSNKVIYIQNQPPLGIPKKLDDLVERSQSKWMLFLGDDDWLEPDYLKTMASQVSAHPDACLIRTRYRLSDPEGNFIKLDSCEASPMGPVESFASLFRPWYEIHINISGVLFQTEIKKNIGKFPDFYQGYYVDRVAWAALAANGKMIFETAPLINLTLFDPRSLSAKFDPTFQAFLTAKCQILEQTRKIHEELSKKFTSVADQALLSKGWKNVVESVKGDCNFYMDKLCIQILKDPDRQVIVKIEKVVDEFYKTRLPIPPRFRFFLFLSRLPFWLRVSLLSVFRKMRHLWALIFKPKTFSIKPEP